MIYLIIAVFLVVFVLLRNEIVFRTGMRAIDERHPNAYGGGKQYPKDMLDLRKWTYKQFYK